MELTLDMSKRYTCDDYLSWNDNVRRELIDGMVKLMAGVNKWHNSLTVNITEVFRSIFKKQKYDYWIFHAPFDVFLSDDTVVQPDFGVVCDLSKVVDNGIKGSPDLLVEVLSPSSFKRDANEKMQLYEKYGVREYWIINPIDRNLYKFLLQDDGKYDEGTFYDAKSQPVIKVSIIDDLEISLTDIFGR